jgi:hypothetical protein
MLKIESKLRDRRLRLSPALSVLCALVTMPLYGGTILTFKGLNDLQSVDDFYAGVRFSNAVAHIAGLSLNEAEFPPASGSTVASNNGGPVTIAWTSPLTDFTGLFTYTAPLTLTFSLSGTPAGAAMSAFADNLALSGEPGSSPNEQISFHSASAFDSILIESEGSFGMDSIFFEKTVQVVPEPSTYIPIFVILTCALYVKRRFRAAQPS